MLQLIRNFFNGLVFGISLIIPGVSGGTLAIILGFYDQLIEAVNYFMKDFRRHVKFLVPFAVGIAAGIMVFASVIQFLLSHHSFPVMMFFIGLIAGTIPGIYRQALNETKEGRIRRPLDVTLVLIPLVLLMLTAHLNDGAATVGPEGLLVDIPFMFFIFVIGIIAAASLLIPGLSGSFVLLVAGIYPLATYAVSSIRLLLLDIGNVELIVNIAQVLGPLGLGIVIGVLATARLIERLLARHMKAVLLVVLGLMFGSIYALLLDPILLYSGLNWASFAIGLASCGLGVIMSHKVSRKGIKLGGI